MIEQANHPMYNPINGSNRSYLQGSNQTPYLDLRQASPMSRNDNHSINSAHTNYAKSAGRPGRAIQILPGHPVNPNVISNGKRVYPNSGTVGQYIPEQVAQDQWLKGGKRVEPTL